MSVNLDNLDVVFLLDKSGSMNEQHKNGQTRWKAAQETVTALATEMAAHDKDGITVVPFNDRFTIEDNVTPTTVGNIFKNHSPGSGTMLAAPLQAVIDKFIPASAQQSKGGFLSSMFGSKSAAPAAAAVARKPVCVVVATDGAAGDEDAVVQTLVGATQRMQSDDELGILLLQVGNDPNAERFLERVDNQLKTRGAKFDIVARCKLDDVEDKSTVELLSLAFNG